MESQVSRLKGAQALFFVLAILCTIMSLPLAGYLISITSFGLVHLLLLLFAIITLVFALRASAPRTGTLLVMIAVIPGIISAVLMFNGIRIADRLGLDITAANHVYEAMHSGELTVFFVGFNIGIMSWTLYLLAAILLFLNVSNVRIRYKDLERGDSFLTKAVKKSDATSIRRDEQVEQAMGFHPEYDEKMHDKKGKATNQGVEEVGVPKVEKAKKVDATSKKVKVKSSNKTGTKPKTTKAKTTSTVNAKKPTKAKSVSKKPKIPKKDK